MLDKVFLRKKLEEFYLEDVGHRDITTDSLPFDKNVEAFIIAKEEGIIAGIEFAKEVFRLIDGSIDFSFQIKDGERVRKGDKVLVIKGSGKAILKGERLALNILQRLSGIATNTSRYIQKLEGLTTKLLDTRKTTPGFRAFEKYAVYVGGGSNHRFALYDMVMIKDNHIKLAGGIKKAVEEIRRRVSPMVKIEVETTNTEEVKEALKAKVDIIMLDNMSLDDIRRAIRLIDRQAKTEASGNITLENIREVAETGVDYISSGAIIHSSRWLDLSLRF